MMDERTAAVARWLHNRDVSQGMGIHVDDDAYEDEARDLLDLILVQTKPTINEGST